MTKGPTVLERWRAWSNVCSNELGSFVGGTDVDNGQFERAQAEMGRASKLIDQYGEHYVEPGYSTPLPTVKSTDELEADLLSEMTRIEEVHEEGHTKG